MGKFAVVNWIMSSCSLHMGPIQMSVGNLECSHFTWQHAPGQANYHCSTGGRGRSLCERAVWTASQADCGEKPLAQSKQDVQQCFKRQNQETAMTLLIEFECVNSKLHTHRPDLN